MKANKWIVVVLVLVCGCKKANLTPDEYLNWMKKTKDMSKGKEIGNYKYKVDVIPAEWIAYTNLFPKNNIGDYKNKLEQAAGMNYFRLTIDMKAGGPNALKYNLHKEQEYFERLYYVSYLMKDDIKMIVNEKEYPCMLYSYERAYDLNSRLSFMVGFAKPPKPGDDVVVEVIPTGLNNDRVKLKFDGDVFQSFPKLLLE